MNVTVIRDPNFPMSKTQWRKRGRGIRDGEGPARFVTIHGRTVGVYTKSQTTKHSPYVVARNYLVDLFVGFPERFGYTAWHSDAVRSTDATSLRCPVGSLIERGFNYAACGRGLRIGTAVAESFHITAEENTNWFVIDLDNHEPTKESTHAHLRLVRAIQEKLPKLHRRVARSSFFQYRMIEPTGIQLWVVTNGKQQRQQLHQAAREFLLSLGADLDKSLREAGLAGLADIEIKPTSNFISMIGCYGKEVFASERLRIRDKRFDCIALYDHICHAQIAGDVLPRYSELVHVRQLESRSTSAVHAKFDPSPVMRPNVSGNLSWTDLKNIAMDGITVPDVLHDRYLEPLAQALLFREFFGSSSAEANAFTAIRAWIIQKHNGLVSRILQGRLDLVERQIRKTITRVLKKTPAGIRDHYCQIRRNDKRFPARVEWLVPLMQAERKAGQFLLIDCKAGVSSVEKRRSIHKNKPLPTLLSLPTKVSSRLAAYSDTCVRKGQMTRRLKTFTHRLISEIGHGGSKEISETRLHQLAGKKPGSDATYLRAWKNHLVKAGILKTGWHQNIVRGVRSSKYQLTAWVVDELNGIATGGPDKPLGGGQKSK